MPLPRKLTDQQVEEVRNLYATTRLSMKGIADEFGVSKWTIRRIIKGETYKLASK